MNSTIKNFIFIRHGYSCANYAQDKWDLLAKQNYEPHLTDYGIIGSIVAGEHISKQVDIKNADIFVSPLLRTWETLKAMFPDCKKATIAPYTKEDINVPNILKSFLIGKDDTAKPFQENYQKFIKVFMPRYNEIKKSLAINDDNLVIDHTNYNNSPAYTDGGDLLKFIENYKGDKNTVVVICHKYIMMQLLKKFDLDTDQYPFQNPNLCIRVRYADKDFQSMQVLFDGIPSPVYEDNCSICDHIYRKQCNVNRYKNIYQYISNSLNDGHKIYENRQVVKKYEILTVLFAILTILIIIFTNAFGFALISGLVFVYFAKKIENIGNLDAIINMIE
jgi:broad specificity phosphatase PhoE